MSDWIKKPVWLKKYKMYNVIFFCRVKKIFLVLIEIMEKFKRETVDPVELIGCDMRRLGG